MKQNELKLLIWLHASVFLFYFTFPLLFSKSTPPNSNSRMMNSWAFSKKSKQRAEQSDTKCCLKHVFNSSYRGLKWKENKLYWMSSKIIMKTFWANLACHSQSLCVCQTHPKLSGILPGSCLERSEDWENKTQRRWHDNLQMLTSTQIKDQRETHSLSPIKP